MQPRRRPFQTTTTLSTRLSSAPTHRQSTSARAALIQDTYTTRHQTQPCPLQRPPPLPQRRALQRRPPIPASLRLSRCVDGQQQQHETRFQLGIMLKHFPTSPLTHSASSHCPYSLLHPRLTTTISPLSHPQEAIVSSSDRAGVSRSFIKK